MPVSSSTNSPIRLEQVDSALVSAGKQAGCSANGPLNQTGAKIITASDPTVSQAQLDSAVATAVSGYASYVPPAQDSTVNGNLISSMLGRGLRVKEGANAKQGVATLVAGAVTVANTSVTASSRIFLSRMAPGGTLGHLSCTVIAATSFKIQSSSATDISTVCWEIFEPG